MHTFKSKEINSGIALKRTNMYPKKLLKRVLNRRIHLKKILSTETKLEVTLLSQLTIHTAHDELGGTPS